MCGQFLCIHWIILEEISHFNSKCIFISHPPTHTYTHTNTFSAFSNWSITKQINWKSFNPNSVLIWNMGSFTVSHNRLMLFHLVDLQLNFWKTKGIFGLNLIKQKYNAEQSIKWINNSISIRLKNDMIFKYVNWVQMGIVHTNTHTHTRNGSVRNLHWMDYDVIRAWRFHWRGKRKRGREGEGV